MKRTEPVWHVLYHPDRRDGQVSTRQLTPEEKHKYGIESREDTEMAEINKNIKRKSLKPRVLISQELEGIEYHLYSEYLQIKDDNGDKWDIAWEDLENFLADLQEVKAIE